MTETSMTAATAWPSGRRITIRDLQAATDRGERWSMLTSYDTLTAGVFEQAGVRALLVGDTSAEMVLGYPTTVPMTMDQLVPMVQAVVRGTRTALVVADLPFGSYQSGPEAALASAVRQLKEGGAQGGEIRAQSPFNRVVTPEEIAAQAAAADSSYFKIIARLPLPRSPAPGGSSPPAISRADTGNYPTATQLS
jgi:2-methylisocitrate lyase-like PEP mutase family enzyme